MQFDKFSFRLAEEILSQRPSWSELEQVIKDIEPEDIVKFHESIVSEKTARYKVGPAKGPAGAQSALNRLFKDRLVTRRWKAEPILFPESEEGLGEWKMDFLKDRIGVEITFNHAEAIAWTFTRVTLAGESTEVIDGSRIDTGVIVYASQSLKRWGKMDSAVGTFERARLWLQKMRPVMPIPILLIGLKAESNNGVRWAETRTFRGTAAGGRRN